MLRVEGLSVRYGGVRAVDGVSLEVGAGSLVGLIGPNGAGKTTCIDAICGFTPCDGQVELDGRRIEGTPPHERARSGLVRTFQSVELFDDLDVAGNLLVAAADPRWWRPLADLVHPGRQHSTPGVDDALALLGIEHLLGRSTHELSEGERKLVGLARALVRQPKVLLLDEPAAGLDTTESEALGTSLRAIVAGGTAVLLVDHDMDLVLGVCDRVLVLEHGELIAVGSPEQIRADDRVVAAYLGTGSAT